MKVKDVLDNYPISLPQLKKLTKIPSIYVDDEVTDYGLGFIDGYLRCEEVNKIARKTPKKPATKKIEAKPKKKPSQPPKQNSKPKATKKKKKRKSVWAISVPMGGMNKWSRKRRRVNT